MVLDAGEDVMSVGENIKLMLPFTPPIGKQ